MNASPLTPPMPPHAPEGVGGLGVLMRLRRNALTAFPARCLHEPVVSLRALGRPLVLACSAQAIGEVLATRAGDYQRMPAARRVLGPIAGRGLLTSEGARWRRQRMAMAPAFTPRALPMMSAHILRATGAACADLEAQAVGGTVDILAAMQALSLEIAAASMFSIETHGFRGALRAMIGDYMRGIGRPAPEDFLLPEGLPTPLMLRRRAFRARWRRLIDGVIADRRARPPGEARDLFDLLCAAQGEGEDAVLRDQVATMIVAGHETTALTLFWALLLLAQAPEWAQAVRAEAAGLDLAPQAGAAALARLPRTRAVVDETLRLYSPAFMTARLAITDTRVAGRRVPRGSMVLTPFWMLHRRPDAWAEPERFDPARFLDARPGRGTFLPFGAGPHACIGSQLAVTEAVLALALITRRFHVALADDGEPVRPVATLSTRPDRAPAFRLTPLP